MRFEHRELNDLDILTRCSLFEKLF